MRFKLQKVIHNLWDWCCHLVKTLGLLATITLEVVSFCTYVLVPSASAIFFNASWKSRSVRVFSTACDSASITSGVKMEVFQFYLQLGKQRKVGWVGDYSHVAFGQKFPGEKGSVKH
jgi:hypothetical protein